MDAAQYGPVSKFGAQRRDLTVEIFFADFAQARMPEFCGNCLHLAGDGGVIVGRCGMIGSDFHKHQPVSVLFEIEFELLRFGMSDILKVHEGKSTQAHGCLVHETAGLAVVVIFGSLTHLRKGDGVDGGGRPECLHGSADGRLDGSRARKPATGGDRAGHSKVKSCRNGSRCGNLVCHSAHKACCSALFFFYDFEGVERDLEGFIPFGSNAHDVGAVCAGDAVNCHVEGRSDNVPTFVIGMITRYFGTSRRMHVQHAFFVDGAKR